MGDPLGPSTSRVALPNHTVAWYRTKLPPEVHKTVHAKSDAQGAWQTIGFLGMLGLWFVLALRLQAAGRPGAAFIFVALYGAQSNFCINGMHELGHGHVFRTRWLNGVFCRVVSFLGWLHPDMFAPRPVGAFASVDPPFVGSSVAISGTTATRRTFRTTRRRRCRQS